jgi:aminomethyltransferase
MMWLSLMTEKYNIAVFPNRRRGIVDELLIYRFNEEKYLLVVNAANIAKDWDWCVQHAGKFGLKEGSDLLNASDSIAQLAIQGPLAMKTIQKLTDTPVDKMDYYTFKEVSLAGITEQYFQLQ